MRLQTFLSLTLCAAATSESLFLQSSYEEGWAQGLELHKQRTEWLLNTVGSYRDRNGLYQPVFTKYNGQTCRPEHFEKIAKLGGGSQGVVWLAKHTSGISVALKVIMPESIGDLEATRAEEVFLKRLDHPSIPKLICCFRDDYRVLIAMDYIQGKDLFHSIYRKKMTDGLYKSIMKQLTEVLGYLHLRHIMHRDLKPENIMIGTNGQVFLIDFDHSRMAHSRINGACGTTMNMAPEIIRREFYDNGIDWYAAGLVLYEMIVRGHPYDRFKTKREVLNAAMMGAPRSGNHVADDLIRRISAPDPRVRWSHANGDYERIIGHPLFSNAE
jgi:serine/threonine protein kinase